MRVSPLDAFDGIWYTEVMGKAGAFDLAVQWFGSAAKLKRRIAGLRREYGQWAPVARDLGISRQTLVAWRRLLGLP